MTCDEINEKFGHRFTTIIKDKKMYLYDNLKSINLFEVPYFGMSINELYNYLQNYLIDERDSKINQIL